MRFHARNIEELSKLSPEIGKCLEEKGWLVIEAWDTSESTLQAVCRELGIVQDQPWAGTSGFVEVAARGNQVGSIRLSRPVEFRAHTDASYLNGTFIRGGKLSRIGPPKIMCLQVVRQAQQGGDSIIVDGARIWRELKHDALDIARRLSEQRPLSFAQQGRVAAGFPLFERTGPGKLKLRFRSDILFVEPYAVEAMEFVIEKYLFNPKFEERHRLLPGQILITDNHRVLHGRDAFALGETGGDRLLRRAWIWDEGRGPSTGQEVEEGFIQPGYERLLPREAAPQISRRLELGIKERE